MHIHIDVNDNMSTLDDILHAHFEITTPATVELKLVQAVKPLLTN